MNSVRTLVITAVLGLGMLSISAPKSAQALPPERSSLEAFVEQGPRMIKGLQKTIRILTAQIQYAESAIDDAGTEATLADVSTTYRVGVIDAMTAVDNALFFVNQDIYEIRSSFLAENDNRQTYSTQRIGSIETVINADVRGTVQELVQQKLTEQSTALGEVIGSLKRARFSALNVTGNLLYSLNDALAASRRPGKSNSITAEVMTLVEDLTKIFEKGAARLRGEKAGIGIRRISYVEERGLYNYEIEPGPVDFSVSAAEQVSIERAVIRRLQVGIQKLAKGGVIATWLKLESSVR